MLEERGEERGRAGEQVRKGFSALHFADAEKFSGDVWGADTLPRQAAVEQVEQDDANRLDVIAPAWFCART